MAVGEILFSFPFWNPAEKAQPRSLDGEATASRREENPKWPRACGKERVFEALGSFWLSFWEKQPDCRMTVFWVGVLLCRKLIPR